MGSITDFLENELLDHIFNAAYTPPATIYLALATADPTDAATGASMSEHPDAGGYARTAITFAAAASRSIAQNAAVNYPVATANWTTVTHWAITDSATHGAGNVLAHGSLNAPKSVLLNDTPTVASGEVTIAFSANQISDYLSNKFLDFAFRNQTFTKPDTYIAMTTVVVADTDTGTTITEPAGGAYARKQVNVNGGASPTWDLAASGVVDNTHAIAFTPATASWGTIVATAIVDAATVGNLLFYDNAVTDKPVDNGDTAEFAIGAFDIALT